MLVELKYKQQVSYFVFKKAVGKENIRKMLAVDNDVTLMFAIDTTGSMKDEIDAAKNITQAIVDHPRKGKVDYVLSPFNHPSL